MEHPFTPPEREGWCLCTRAFHHTEGRKHLFEVQVDSFGGLSKHLGFDRLKTC